MTNNLTLDIDDRDALLAYLKETGRLTRAENPLVCKLEGGVSNRVVLVKPETGAPFVLKQALEKLRVQVDWFCAPARIDREALALKYLQDLAPPGTVPALIFQDSSQHLLAMEQVPEPHRNWKAMLLAGNVRQPDVEQFARLLGAIHLRSSQDRTGLSSIFADRSFFDALRLEPYYRYTASLVPAADTFLQQLIVDTLAIRLALVHGDYSPKNVLVYEDRLILLDYEVVHFGDPAFDVGFSMAHFLGKAHALPIHQETFTGAALDYWSTYLDCVASQDWAGELEPRAVRHTLACCLARAAGRSPFEYLTPDQRSAQVRAVLRILERPPATFAAVIPEFISQLTCK